MHERTALFVEQRERFHLSFVATSCDLNFPNGDSYSPLEITLYSKRTISSAYSGEGLATVEISYTEW